MEQEMTEIEKRQYKRELFIKLLLMLRAGALQNLGKITNPLIGEKKVNIEIAKETIDMISLIKDKTEGNLSEQENEMIVNLLTELQLLYVNASSK